MIGPVELATSRTWAALLGVTSRCVGMQVVAGRLPPPDFTAGPIRLWYPHTVEQWAATNLPKQRQ